VKASAVLISDVHFNINTLGLASVALTHALAHAEELDVPLIIAGDLNDTKAVLRAECANTLVDILGRASDKVRVLVLIGNHDLINEKAKEHSLNFLAPYCEIVAAPRYDRELDLWLVPYQSNLEELQGILKVIKPGSTVIMHQGIMSAAMGEYTVDKSSITPEELAPFCVISGHYHMLQTIITDGKKHATNYGVGTANYIGTPYSVTYAEANDGPKGFRVLHDSGVLTQVETRLRKHVKVERAVEDVLDPIEGLKPTDLLWFKVHGPASELDKLSKKQLGLHHLGHQNFKFDKDYAEAEAVVIEDKTFTDAQMLDMLVDESEETSTAKVYLKALWRDILE
jgi:hypothetical protein